MIAEGLPRIEGERTVLLGSRCQSAGRVRFPAEQPELYNGTDDIVPIEVSTEGTLFTYTTQEFAYDHAFTVAIRARTVADMRAEVLRLGEELVSTTVDL